MIDPRIGKLNSGTFYAYVNGYDKEPVMGSLEQVEYALGLRSELPVEEEQKEAMQYGKTYDVKLSFEFPAWDEKEGIFYRGIVASSKKEAIAQVRRMASDDGHAVGGRGKYWLSAEEKKD